MGIMLHDSRSGGLEGGHRALGVGTGGVRRQVTGQARQALRGRGELLVKACRREEPVETASHLSRGGIWEGSGPWLCVAGGWGSRVAGQGL